MADPKVFIGLLIGGAVPFLFSSLAIRAVGRTAGVVVQEVRSQFADGKIMSGEKRPDYAPVIDICTRASLRELTTPALLAVLTPVIIGFGIGYTALGGFLAAVILVGQLMANYLSNAGGAWDNAKKYIEDGHHGGKGSEAHMAAVIGDTVGDPFKDTAGPALNPLIKVMNLVSLLILPAIISLSTIDEDNILSSTPEPAGYAVAAAGARRAARGHRLLQAGGRRHRPRRRPRRGRDGQRPGPLARWPRPRQPPCPDQTWHPGRGIGPLVGPARGQFRVDGEVGGMVAIDRRRFLPGSAAAGGAALAGTAGPFAGFLAGPAAAAPPAGAGARARPPRRDGAAVAAAGVPVPLVPRHRADRTSWTTAPCCRAATTAWPRSRARTATCCWSATTR